MTQIKQTIAPAEIVPFMVEFVRRRLTLNDMKGPDKFPQHVSFTGRDNDGIMYAFDIITKIDRKTTRDGYECVELCAASQRALKKRIEERQSPRLRKDRIYTAVLFPATLHTKEVDVDTPYLRPAELLATAKGNFKLLRMYDDFGHTNVKHLSDIEWRIALEAGMSTLAYFSPECSRNYRGRIHLVRFVSFPENQLIPDNIPLDAGYFWSRMRNPYPSADNYSRFPRVFRQIQEGLHHRVRKIHSHQDITGSFTLVHNDRGGACIIETPKPLQLELF